MLLTANQTRLLYERATVGHFAILAVNADSPAAVVDCLEAAKQTQAPIIIETSLWQLTGRSFGLGDPILGLARYLTDLAVLSNSERYKNTPVVFHTDHIKGPETLAILTAAINGIPTNLSDQEQRVFASSLSLDSSELSAEENIEMMCTLCSTAEARSEKATLEMEAGVDKGVTPPSETKGIFGAVEERHPGHLALWAPGVGTQHGLDDGNHIDSDAIQKHQELATEICSRPIGLALHGSSGLSNDALQAAVQAGTAKVNWSSESLLIRSSLAKRYFETHSEQLSRNHPDFKSTAMDNGLQSFIAEQYIPKVGERIEILGGKSKAPAFMAQLN